MMKSNRMLLKTSAVETANRFESHHISTVPTSGQSLDLKEMPAPLAISRVAPDQIIEDILVSTLLRLQSSAKGDLAAAAARYLTLLREKAL
jgi:hypothetical protein